MSRLRAEYDAIQNAMQTVSGMQGDAQGALNQLGGIVDDMLNGNWEGLAAQMFQSFFGDIVSTRANEILQEFEEVQRKLSEIQQIIQDNDDQAAGLFRAVQ